MGWNYCPHCGKELPKAEAAPPPAPEPMHDEIKKLLEDMRRGGTGPTYWPLTHWPQWDVIS